MNEDSLSLDDILERCLTAIETQGWTVDECLRHYPEYQAELKAYLQTAEQFRRMREIAPSLEFRQQAVARLHNRLKLAQRSQPHPQKAPHRPSLWQSLWMPRRFAFTLAALVSILGFSAVTTGTIYAAGNALPGEPLYPVEQTVEQVRLTLTSPDQRSGLQMSFAEKRIVAAEKLAQTGDSQHMKQALDDYDRLVDEITKSMPGADPAQLDILNATLAVHQARLQALLNSAPPAALGGIANAIEASRRGQAKAQQGGKGHSGAHPVSTSEPGQPDAAGGAATEAANGPEQATGTPSADHGKSPGANTCANGTALSGSTVGHAHQLANKYDVAFDVVWNLFCSGLSAEQVEAQLVALQPATSPKGNNNGGGTGKGKP